MLKSLKIDVKIILFGVLLTSFSTYMLSPFLTLFMNKKGFSPSQIGLVLAVSLIFQQGFTFFGGLLGDKYSYKRILLVGLIIRSFGYLFFAFSDSLIFLIISTSLVGMGGALITPSTKACIVAEKETGSGLLALRNVALNIGAALGPIVGALLYNTSFYIVFFIAAFIHMILFVLVLFFVKTFKYTESNNMLAIFTRVVKDTRIIYLTVVSSIFWILYSQLTLSVPLYMKNYLNLEKLTGTLFVLNGVVVIVLQFHLLQFFEKKCSLPKVLSYGMFFVAASFAFMLILPNIYGVYIFIVLFTVGEILIGPSIDNMASSIAPSKSNVGGYIGFVSLGWAIGGTIGNIFGGYLYGVTSIIDGRIIWIVYVCLAIIAAILYRKLEIKMSVKSGVNI